jgi:hypothetical protein
LFSSFCATSYPNRIRTLASEGILVFTSANSRLDFSKSRPYAAIDSANYNITSVSCGCLLLNLSNLSRASVNFYKCLRVSPALYSAIVYPGSALSALLYRSSASSYFSYPYRIFPNYTNACVLNGSLSNAYYAACSACTISPSN